MIHWGWLIPAVMFGGFVGVLVMSLMAISARGEHDE